MRSYTYTVALHPNERDEEAGFSVEVPALPGCFSRGRTRAEALANAEEAIQCHLESRLRRGQPIPEEDSELSIAAIKVSLPQMA